MGAIIFFSLLILVLATPALALRFGFADAWKQGLNRVVLVAYGALFLCCGIYFIAKGSSPQVAKWAVVSGQAIALAGLGVVATALIWGPLRLWYRRKRRGDASIDTTRRTLLLRSAQAIPAASVLLSPTGVKGAMSPPIIKPIQISISDLPESLNGLSILQLTDIHLGLQIDPAQVKAITDALVSPPDLIVLTGDIADDYAKLGPTLEILSQVNAPLGVYACIGNHEIYRGRKEAERIYQKHGVPLLANNGVVLTYNGTPFWLAGSDDPARLFRRRRQFYAQSIQQAMRSKPKSIQTSILLCHRPTGFDAAAQNNVTLTLSGHTHGAQMAIGDRSILEPLLPKKYLKGHYQQGNSHLYTSSGLGHWLPFRLNCPCEAPLIRLTKSP